jgi:polysaccharide biosynthesis protein PslH
MTKPGAGSEHNALFLTPEAPVPGTGGGGLRSASMLAYLQGRYQVQVARFTLPHHSTTMTARLWRNGLRFLKGSPPLLDRYSGFEAQLAPYLERRYQVAVIEHFWCAPYARTLRPHTERLVLDLHNIESELSASHARATKGLESIAFRRFASAYRRLEAEWLPQFDVLLVASEEDRRRVKHPNVHVFPNALPEIARPDVPEADCIVFSGNLEYHPNVEAIRWFRSQVWPKVRASHPSIEWRLAGSNAQGVVGLAAGDARIRIISPVSDAVRLLAEAKVCVVPLLSGSGTRFKILEAWAAGRAVVSTSIGAEGLGAQSGRHLIIADGPAEFAAAILHLLNDPGLRRQLGDAGRELYLERFSWSAAWKLLAGAGF